ncbi:uncharacterized protein LOC128205233 [Mya arenaria]|uniref:uncharacterized protein LOC128205233 n=1 Tax=Mya arenaria TaxID=6604 RepID=UPI0022E86AC2|nr:uncharacterized protein LOC128205233 [Mya arenaria]
MASYKAILEEKDSENWFKSVLALRITGYGLRDLAEDGSARTQRKIFSCTQTNFPTFCGLCRTSNILPCPTRGLCSHAWKNCTFHDAPHKMYKPCPNRICEYLRYQIYSLHRFEMPSWRNTRAEMWNNNHFEVAKCFMGEGYHDAASFDDVDLNGVLDLMMNCKEYESYFSFLLTHPKNILTEIRDISRFVRHSPELRMSDELFEMCIVKCTALLKDSTWLSSNPRAKAAVAKLNQLMTDDMPELEQEESKFALAQAAKIVTEVQDLIDMTLGGETARPVFSYELEGTEGTLKYIQTSLKRIQNVMKKGSSESTDDDIRSREPTTDSGYGTCSMKSSVYAKSADDVLSCVSDVNFTEKEMECFQMKIKQWQTEDLIFKGSSESTGDDIRSREPTTDSGYGRDWYEQLTSVEFIKDDTSLAESMRPDLSEPCVNTAIGPIPVLMKKDIGTMTEYRDGPFLTDSMKTDMVETNGYDQLEDQNETDEPSAAISETLFTQTQLNELCSRDGRKSKTVSRKCDLIVNHLKETFDNILCSNNEILHIYPAFKVGKENEIIFVVTLSKTTDVSLLCNAVAYTLEIRVLHKFSNELKTLMDAVHAEGHGILDECQRPIAVTIGKWAKPLLEAHKYLSVITASPLKSKRNKNREILQSFVREPECCIVFCVHAKDFIYIKEDPLPAKLNGISTDVMEGAFVTFGRLSHESHDKLPMGCEIGRGESRDIGTLGGFIDHPEYGLCGITSGHMCLDHAEYEACVKNNGRLMLEQWPEGSRGREMFQPAKLQKGDEVGHLVEVLYQVGSHLESGFDVALFQIEKKYPADGIFPAEKINDLLHDVAYTFKSGNVCGVSRAADKSLWKFGRTSGSTKGKTHLKTPMTAVKEVPLSWRTPDQFQIMLLNQFAVSPIGTDPDKKFANYGDSGALVFIDEEKDDLTCVGMVAGGEITSSIAIISPICPILKHCNVTKFHSFYKTPRQNNEAIERLETMYAQLDNRMASIDEHIGQNGAAIERLETMYSQLDQRMASINDNIGK